MMYDRKTTYAEGDFLPNDKLVLGILFDIARERGYAVNELRIAHRDAAGVKAITFIRADQRSVTLEVPYTILMRAARESFSYLVGWLVERFERDVLPMLAHYPRPHFRIATRRQLKRLQYDARKL